MTENGDHPQPSSIPIAVVGMSGIFPDSCNLDEFWAHIRQGDDLLSEVPESHWLKEDFQDPERGLDIPSARGGFLPWMDFDPLEFGIPPNQLSRIDTVQLLTLLAARDLRAQLPALLDGRLSPDRVSVILGVAAGTELIGQMSGKIQRGVWQQALRQEGVAEDVVQNVCNRIEDSYADWDESTFPGLLANVVAGRVTNRFDFGGTNCSVDAACASSLAALTMGIYELQLGISDLVISGGADALNDPFMHMCFSRTHAISKQGDCRPFDQSADGTLLGEGIGLIALRRLADAEADGDEIQAVIRGYGSSSDGKHKSIYAPRPAGQAKALRRAYQRAGFDPPTIGLVEAHGTGTIAGDAAEVESLREVYSGNEDSTQPWCALGSVKSQIGHTKSAAGAAALIKVVMALRHGVLPPTLKVDRPSPGLKLEGSPFYLNTRARPWLTTGDSPKRGAVSSFGFGGANYHFVLEQYQGTAPQPRRIPSADCGLILVSASDSSSLRQRIQALEEQLKSRRLVDVAAAAQLAFEPALPLRCAVVSSSPEDATSRLHQALQSLESADPGYGTAPGVSWAKGEIRGKLAFLFPGQGSQYCGMGSSLLQEFAAAQKTWQEGAHSLKTAGFPCLSNLVFPAPSFDAAESQEQEHRLRETKIAQPAIGLTSASLLDLLRNTLGVEPDLVAGHSFGEITALYAAGAIPDLSTFLTISAQRGDLLSATSDATGSMLALSTSLEQAQSLLEQHAPSLTIANDNAPNQVVVAGPHQAVEQFAASLKEHHLSFRRLEVSNAFHSDLVADRTPEFINRLSPLPWQEPAVPVYSNTLAAPYPSGAEHQKNLLGEQLRKPVRFREMVASLYEAGARTFVEVGPHSVLQRLVGQCLADQEHYSVSLDSSRSTGLKPFWNGLGQLAVLGHPLDFKALWEDFQWREEDSSSSEASPATVRINGANYGKPYPPKGGLSSLAAPVIPSPQSSDPAPAPSPFLDPEPIPPVPLQPVPSMPDEPPHNPSPNSSAPVDALLAIHQAAIEAQRAYQETLERSHQEFLRLTQQSLISLTGETPSPVPEPSPVPLELPQPVSVNPTPPEAPPLPPPTPAAESISVGSIPPADSSPTLPEATSSVSFQEALLEVVSESTGYPVEMLDLDQELESGLGIDSIKRVEILSALQQRFPELSQEDPDRLSALRTLREIVDLAGSPDPGLPSESPTESPAAPSFQQALLETVSESTGYPLEMLDLDQELEAGLGIDSIKRVEILSALQQRFPELEQEDSAQLSSLRTLREIVTLATGSTRETTPLPSTEPARAETFQDELLRVVAESTGYPLDMLRLDQDLEADLGIDSIKRVEILSALQQIHPELADQDSNHLSSLRTLGEIVALASAQTAGSHPEPVTAPTSAPALVRYLVTPSPRPRPGLGMAGLRDGAPLYLVGDKLGVAEKLAELLSEAGLEARVVESAPSDATHLILLQGLNPVKSHAQAESSLLGAFDQVKTSCESMSQSGRLLVTVQDLGGSFGHTNLNGTLRPWTGGISAIARTLRREWGKTSVKAIDISTRNRTPDEIASELALELFLGGSELEVGLGRNGERNTIELVPDEPVPEHPSTFLNAEDVVLVSGGARGVTAECLKSLAATQKLRFVILGRTALEDEPSHLNGATSEAEIKAALLSADSSSEDTAAKMEHANRAARRILANREVHANLDVIRKAGSEVLYLASDVTKAQDVNRALEKARLKFGPIQAIIHAAGVLRDTRLLSMTREQYETVLATKVTGLRHLLRATKDDPLRMLCCFSSIAARVGNEGQLNYNVANEVLNKVCLSEKKKRGADFFARSIAWGAWEGGMVTPHLQRHFEQLGVTLIPIAQGAAAFVEELKTSSENGVEVLLSGPVKPEFLEGRSPDRESTVLLRNDLCPFLKDHEILGTPVMPVTMAIDLALKCSRTSQDKSRHTPVSIHGLRVLKGIQAPNFLTRGDWLSLNSTPNGSPDSHVVTIQQDDNRRNYELTHEPGLVPSSSPPDIPSDATVWDWDAKTVYRHRALLFHGPDFQVLQSLQRIGDWGCSAELERRTLPPGPVEDWLLDLFVFDGGLQLGLLWCWHQHQHHVLPTSIDRIEISHAGLIEGPVHCQLQAHSIGDAQSAFDIWWTDSRDNVLIHAKKVVMTHIPTSWIPEKIAGKSTAFYAKGSAKSNPAPVA